MRRIQLQLQHLVALAAACLAVSGSVGRAAAKEHGDRRRTPIENAPQGVLVLDGRNVHTAGELQMHVTNWGEFGSRPSIFTPYSWAPSAQWPAGSGVEYLNTAGIWVGALLPNGVPAVSTAAFESEFRPRRDVRDVTYESGEGAIGGNRRPHPNADDDGDGRVDEDRLDGYDNDMDGRVDEDFAAISRQMFACRYTDFEPQSLTIYPNHSPLPIVVEQESYQWDSSVFDDFVAVDFKVTNVGSNILTDVYLGVFADGDAGPRTLGNYWEDDLTGTLFVDAVCTRVGPATIDLAYTYDADGDNGRTPGYFAVMFLGAPGETSDDFMTHKINTYATFAGHQSFQNGGDPTNDFERYELLSRGTIDADTDIPRDYRMLISMGPFKELTPDGTLRFQVAFVAGAGLMGLEGVAAHAAAAKLAFHGEWFDLDNDRHTGAAGRETSIMGPRSNVVVDTCHPYSRPIPQLPPGEVVWINEDCAREDFYMRFCHYTEEDSTLFRTGTGGRETRLKWFANIAPPPPHMRIDDHAARGVVVYWDNSSESVPDPKTQRVDFEGYRIWWADGWTRPPGTSAATGPSGDLWVALREADIINGFGADTGLGELRYDPLPGLSHARKQNLIESLKQYLIAHPEMEPPCPQGVTPAVCDTLLALARWALGLPGGRQYYRYADDSNLQLGRRYFYSVVAFDHDEDYWGDLSSGSAGSPSSNFLYVEPKSVAQPAYHFDEDEVYVVPNPVTSETLAAWRLDPNNDDPTGIKVEFRNLPRATGIIRVYTLAGDLVKGFRFDGRAGNGTIAWDLVSRNGQEITSGVYLYVVAADEENFGRVTGKFTVIR